MKILRASLLHTRPDPGSSKGYQLEFMADAGLLIDPNGLIVEKDEAAKLLQRWPEVPVDDERPRVIVPGFIDSHIHFPQMDMIGACAPSLLPWLTHYTFPEEIRFRGPTAALMDHARAFAAELAAQGTTLAVIYSSSDYGATDCLFQAFADYGLRGIIGKVSMDQHGPQELLVDAQRDLRETEKLLKDWHGEQGRLFYALTPRFAPSCSLGLMQGLAALARNDSSLYIQTHFAENLDELKWVQQLYPKAKDYLDVYESLQLLGSRTILAHCIHTNARERSSLRAHQVIVSHCPTSNLFLGSGLMPYQQYQQQGLPLALGTDVGAGTSFSLWQTINEAYKVAQLRQEPVAGADFFYAATLGGARALQLPSLGALDHGFEADLQVLDLTRKPALARTWQRCHSAEDRLNALIFGGDDRIVKRLLVRGRDIELRAAT